MLRAPTGAANAPPEDLPRLGRPWYLLPLVIGVAALVGLAGFELLPVYLHSSSNHATPHGGTPTRADLCTPSNGTNCGGHELLLPWIDQGTSRNTTSCDAFASNGAGELLWLNFTASAPGRGVVIPAALFGGASGWFNDPAGFVNNSSATARAAWSPSFGAGTFAEAIAIPNDGQLWCLGWWEPSGSITISLSSDLATTYVAPG